MCCTKANLFYHLGEFEKCVQLCETVLKKQSQNPEALYRLGCVFAKQGHFDRAFEYWEKTVSLTSHDPRILNKISKKKSQFKNEKNKNTNIIEQQQTPKAETLAQK
jgi:cytochrome c-type biogenesis protein CcmH/NrfG